MLDRKSVWVLGAVLSMLCIQSLPAHADAKNYYFFRKNMLGDLSLKLKSVQTQDGTSSVVPVTAPEQWFDQKLDHFDAKNPTTFKQRYYHNSSFVTAGAQAPVILYICGEGACTGAEDSGTAMVWAKKLGAHLIAVEHRYYGKSYPFSDLTPEHLQYLSTDQAIEDLANFITSMKKQPGLQGRWLSVGGSYAGALSAYLRLKHPELIEASLASSGPVESRIEFKEYDRSVANGLSASCLSQVLQVTHDAEDAVKDPVRFEELKTTFDVKPITDPVDFLYVIADMAAAAVQYGFQNGFCNSLGTGHPTLETYAAAGTDVLNQLGMKAIESSYKSAESINAADYENGAGMRQWVYQTCFEYGFFQVSSGDPSNTARSTQIATPYHLRACQELFGANAVPQIEAMNKKYYQPLLDPAQASRIFFTNGGLDPWAQLSISTDRGNATNPLLKTLTIAGASHCNDLGGPASSAVASARTQVGDWLNQWVSTQ